MPGRLERLVEELHDEVGNRSALEEARRELLAEWYGGLLQNKRRKNERTVSLTEMMRQGHGLEDDTSPAA